MSEHKEMTSEELLKKVRHMADILERPGRQGVSVYNKSKARTLRILAQRLEEAREAMRQVINDCDDCWNNERCSVHRGLELELQK